MKTRGQLLIALLLVTNMVNAQDFLGYNYSNFQTGGGMAFNPASIANSRYRVNVNLFSINAAVMNNGYEFRNNSLFEDNSMTEGVDFFKINDSADKSIFSNINILGPSVMINLGPRIGAFGISSRMRFISSEMNLNNNIFQLLGNANSNYLGIPFTQNNFMTDAHGFADIGLTYARVLWQNRQHMIKGGVTAKYVMGISSGSLRIDNLSIQVNEERGTNMVKSLQGNMTMLYSAGLDRMADDLDEYDAWDSMEKNGNFGMDIGLEYEWRRRNDNRSTVLSRFSRWKNSRTPYTLKVSVSVTDIGKVKYETSRNAASYTLNAPGGSFPLSDLNLRGDSFDEYLDYLQQKGIVTPSDLPADYTVNLPTTLRINADANLLMRCLFVNAGANIGLLGTNSYGGRYCNYYYVTPRLESKWISVYSPLSYNSLKQVNWGIGINTGVFFIGSGSALSNLFGDTIRGFDIYAGFSIPI